MAPARTRILASLEHAYPRQPLRPDTAAVYMRELADIPDDLLDGAVRAVIRESQWFPTVAEIRAKAADLQLGLPSEPDALAQIQARMEWARQPEADRGDPPALHPLVDEALRRVGGWHSFRSTDQATIIRGQFGRLYGELRAGAIRATQVGGFDAA